MPRALVKSRNTLMAATLAGLAAALFGLSLPQGVAASLSDSLAALPGSLATLPGSLATLPGSLAALPGSPAAPIALLGPPRPVRSPAPATVPAWLADQLSPPDPRATTPAEVSAFFARITDDQAATLTRRYPEIVGNLDGAPAALRYAANASRFPQSAGRQILAFDDRGDGRLAEVLGDLGTAGRVVILVPGVDTELANFDSGLGGVERRSPRWQAHRLHDQIRAAHPDAGVAVVSWLGYDPPEGMSAATIREDRAAAGAEALARFVDGLLLGHPDRSVAVVGHSYGSTVAGLAAPHLSGQVTDLVAIGSPGMGVGDRFGLHTSARVWACAAPDDWIRRVPGIRFLGLGHGTLPSDPEFGALPLPCDEVEGHDGYFVPGTSALPAIAEIATGVPTSQSALDVPAARLVAGPRTSPPALGIPTTRLVAGPRTSPPALGIPTTPLIAGALASPPAAASTPASPAAASVPESPPASRGLTSPSVTAGRSAYLAARAEGDI
jgi:pimeloyl-ACP methyl ester carboxylesterase